MQSTQFVSADTFVYDIEAPYLAGQYVAKRREDAAKLLNEFQWHPGLMPGTLRAELYGHSILWDITGSQLHAGQTDYEVLPQGSTDPWCGTLQQVLAWLLAKHW